MKQLFHDSKGLTMESIDKKSKNFAKRKNRDLVDDINNTFYEQEKVYYLENNILTKTCTNYISSYYEVMN